MMTSSHSQKELVRRMMDFFEDELTGRNKLEIIEKIGEHIQQEYDTIPEKERIGKGLVYIVKAIGKGLFACLKEVINTKVALKDYLMNLISLCQVNDKRLKYLSTQLAYHLALTDFTSVTELVLEWAEDDEWDVRENACYPVIAGLKKSRNETISFLKKHVSSKNENIRRIIAESTRPKAEVKWLRDPAENGEILDLLTSLNHDPAIYVRKAVGNNIKDLSKYMPEKVLDLVEEWVVNGKKLSKRDKKNLRWTIFQGLRWLKDKEPKHHERIIGLIGENYILYFDEKRNRNALPPGLK